MAKSKSVNYLFSSYGRLGLLLSIVGVLLAIDSLVAEAVLYKLWPLLLTILGTGFIGIYLQRARREGSYLGAGIFFIGLSGLALYCNFTSWSRLASLWPLFIGLLGLAMVICYIFGNRRPPILLTGLLSISLATVFYLTFSHDTRLWWTVFILAGCSLIIFDKARRFR